VRQACGQDHRLCGRVESLLDADQQQDGFLKSVGSDFGANYRTSDRSRRPNHRPLQAPAKDRGRGFGVVYMAEQREPVERRVALKIIKPGMDTKQVIARFEASGKRWP